MDGLYNVWFARNTHTNMMVINWPNTVQSKRRQYTTSTYITQNVLYTWSRNFVLNLVVCCVGRHQKAVFHKRNERKNNVWWLEGKKYNKKQKNDITVREFWMYWCLVTLQLLQNKRRKTELLRTVSNDVYVGGCAFFLNYAWILYFIRISC